MWSCRRRSVRRSEERRVGKECQLMTGVQTCALPICMRVISAPAKITCPAVGLSCPEIRLKYVVLPAPFGPKIGRASCRERVSIDDWSSDVCSSDLHAGDIRAGEDHLPGGGSELPGDQVEICGLAGAVRS